jgi:NDP-sugar pyrophosphorylase family protein
VRALILAAGEGRRLGPLTRDVPKPMLPIAGRPVLEHNVRLLVRHGITQIAINTHRRRERIVEHFGDGSAFGAAIRYSYEPVLRGTAGALVPFAGFLSGAPFIVLFGDNLSTCDLTRLADAHGSSRAIATVALHFRAEPGASGVASLRDDGRIVSFVEKPGHHARGGAWVNAGIIVAEPALLASIPRDRPSDLGRDVLPRLLADGKSIHGYPMSEAVWWIDTPEDYERTCAAVSVPE